MKRWIVYEVEQPFWVGSVSLTIRGKFHWRWVAAIYRAWLSVCCDPAAALTYRWVIKEALP